MKKVLHVLSSNKYSGAENVACTIIENFKDEYEMAYCSPIGQIQDKLKEKNIKYFGIKKLSIKEIKRIIKEYKPDIIHAHDYTASVICAISGFNGVIISHLHNNCPFAQKWNIKSLIYYFTIKKYHKIIGVSKKVYDEAVFKTKMKNKYQTVYNFVDKEKIIKKSHEYEYKKKYDIFFFGRLTEQKDPIRFIEIVNQIKQKNRKIKAVMIGDGELKTECAKIIKNNALDENIDLIGFVTNPFPIIKQCKIGIMPSKWEGFGLTAIESIVLNKPILNSGVGGMQEIFKENKELICGKDSEYIEKLVKNKKYDFTNIINRFCNKKEWKEIIKKCYEDI